ncbi:unnamed protein product [Peniophora sp. CBMAI 1063]|nr:unnamed protein product [Peniophora sp. CBMAI 1063]
MANYQPSSTFNAAGLRVFSPLQLQDVNSISSAMDELDTTVMQYGMAVVFEAALSRIAPDSQLDHTTKDLYALPFIISACSTKAAVRLKEDAVGLFPRTRASWNETGVGWRLLLALLKAAYFLAVEPTVTRRYPSLASTDHKHALLQMAHFASVVSRSIRSFIINRVAHRHGPSLAPFRMLDYRIPRIPPFAHTTYLPRRYRSCANERLERRMDEWWEAWRLAHDGDTLSACNDLGIVRPLLHSEAETMCVSLLVACSNMLEDLLAYFRRETIKNAIQSAYTSRTDADPHVLAIDNCSAYSRRHTSPPPTSTSLCIRRVQLNTEFPFDHVEGFGPWRILVEHEARKALREADERTYRVHLAKLQELSAGYLYGDHMKRLKWHNTLLPVYEAKVTRNSRIVYQFHVVPDDDGKAERQVLRIWHISNHVQIDRQHSIWASITDHERRLNARLHGVGRDGPTLLSRFLMGKHLTRASPQVSLSLFNAAGLSVFTPWRLQDHNANDAAVEELNVAVLQVGAPAILKAALDQLDPAAHLARTTSRALYALPYIISVLSMKAAGQLTKDALDLFSRTQDDSDSTYGWRLLRALLKAAFCLPIQPSLRRLRLASFHEHKYAMRDMAHLTGVLAQALLYNVSKGAARTRSRSGSYSGPPSSLRHCLVGSIPHFPVTDGYTPPRSRSHHARRECSRFEARAQKWWETWETAHKDNVCAFDELGVAQPASRSEAHELSRAVVSTGSRILQELLDYFRRDTVKDAVHNVYLRFDDADTTAWIGDDDIATSDWGSHVPTLPDVDGASVAPHKDLEADENENFPFDGDADFGPWRILVTHEARKTLRDADGKMHEVYRRKMQELSHGHLYGDNQKKLVGHKKNQLVPLYEAKITRDTRLVYQIHVVPDEDQLHERQVIRVWAIYSHRQLDKSRMCTVECRGAKSTSNVARLVRPQKVAYRRPLSVRPYGR